MASGRAARRRALTEVLDVMRVPAVGDPASAVRRVQASAMSADTI